MDWLVIWGVSQAAWSVFSPIMEEFAAEVAKDASKNYAGRAFQ